MTGHELKVCPDCGVVIPDSAARRREIENEDVLDRLADRLRLTDAQARGEHTVDWSQLGVVDKAHWRLLADAAVMGVQRESEDGHAPSV